MSSKLSEAFEAGRPVVALEITPPARALPRVLLRRAGMLGGLADVVNVIHRSDRTASLDASCTLLEEGFEPVWHVVTRDCDALRLRDAARRARDAGIRAALCIRGDHAGKDAPGAPRIRDAIAILLEEVPGLLVGATFNPYVELDRALANLLPKLAVGARFVQTQPVFSLEPLRDCAGEVARRAPHVKLIPMVMPLLSLEAAERVGARLGIPIPDASLSRLARGGAEAGWEIFGETLQALASAPWVHGIAVMTPALDLAPDVSERLQRTLRTHYPR